MSKTFNMPYTCRECVGYEMKDAERRMSDLRGDRWKAVADDLARALLNERIQNKSEHESTDVAYERYQRAILAE